MMKYGYQGLNKKTVVIMSGFPFIRALDEFDFQPSINKREILDLSALRFIEERKNILLVWI